MDRFEYFMKSDVTDEQKREWKQWLSDKKMKPKTEDEKRAAWKKWRKEKKNKVVEEILQTSNMLEIIE